MSVVTDTIGLTDSKGAEQASQASTAMTKEQLDFDKQRYADWKAVYGPLQEDLGTYYKNLTGSTLSAKHVESIQMESQLAQQQIDQTLAQRGISGGGLEASLTNQNIFGTSMQKATARASGDQMANEQKLNFLNLGLGQGAQIGNNIAQTSASGASGLRSQAAGLEQSNQSTIGSMVGTGVGIWALSDKRLKTNLNLVNTIKGINFYTWDWNEKAEELGLSGSSFGVIAQEIEDIILNAINYDSKYMSVNYSMILDYIKDN